MKIANYVKPLYISITKCVQIYKSRFLMSIFNYYFLPFASVLSSCGFFNDPIVVVYCTAGSAREEVGTNPVGHPIWQERSVLPPREY